MSKVILSLACLLFCGNQEIKTQPRNANAKAQQQQAANSPSPAPVNDAAEAASEAYRKERDTKEDIFREDQARQSRIVSDATVKIYRVTAIYVFVTAVYAFFAFLTWREIGRQATSAKKQVEKTGDTLEEIKKQRKILNTQAIAALSQARSIRESLIVTTKAAHDQLLAMQGQWKAMEESLEAMREQYAAEKDFMKLQIHNLSDQSDVMEASYELSKQSIRQNEQTVKAMQGQLAAMERQEQSMRDQAKLMDRSLVLGTRAYLGIHSVNLDIASKRLFLHLENVGRVPAKNIKVVTEILAEVPETKYRALCTQPPQTLDWGQREGERWLQIPFLNHLGRTKLFPGNLRVPIMIRLDNSPYFSDQQFSLITGGYAKFTMRGLITYSDGFHSGKRTEFAFRYFGKNNLWVPEAIEGPQMQTDSEKPDSDYNPN